ncbi:hypothetical protein NAEGRDRAFT_46328 [Naegleria gruberi]|uniref:Uncharacterized protein n=1 Tax=Naegleria gruberi TaxID=5762 RepID=D2V363_NAEGR|nr:uncharacterized protein NAEGRDRAFT_46328 [Naegleria gruberi]EFC48721.1 hypothetical protein NAEGRDRAFT_46328 [Naegleria gruberi]|eukprot:XP_002681465.1 hypothetical protein NAEGRDRAFT_46328 [Naegleria gruberi strain NEG-M]
MVEEMHGLDYCDSDNLKLFEEERLVIEERRHQKTMWRIDDQGFEKPLHIIKSVKFLERVLEMSDSKAFSDAYSLNCISNHLEQVMGFVSDRFNEDEELCKRIIEIVASLMEKNIEKRSDEIWKNCFASLMSVFNTSIYEDNKIAYEWKMSELVFGRLMYIANRLKLFENVTSALLEQVFKHLKDRLTFVKELYNGKPFYILKIYDNLVTIIFENYQPQVVDILMRETENIITIMKGNNKDDLECMFLTKVISKIAKFKNLKALNVI